MKGQLKKYKTAYINLHDLQDPAAVFKAEKDALMIASDEHSYAKSDRIFPINQDENSVFAQYVYQDSRKHQYKRVLDMGTGSGVLAIAMAKAGAEEVLAVDINKRAEEFVKANSELNGVRAQFVLSNLFSQVRGKFDKIVMDPPFMPAPQGDLYPRHAQSQTFGYEIMIEPFFTQCWSYLNPGGCIQIITQSFAGSGKDSVLDLMKKYLPAGWSYEIRHVFPVKEIPIELYTSGFIDFKGYGEWIGKIQQRGYDKLRFFMMTIRNNGRDGLCKEELSKPRIYSLIYPPTQLKYLQKKLEIKKIKNPISEKDWPTIGHLMRLNRYNYYIYLTLVNLFKQGG